MKDLIHAFILLVRKMSPQLLRVWSSDWCLFGNPLLLVGDNIGTECESKHLETFIAT